MFDIVNMLVCLLRIVMEKLALTRWSCKPWSYAIAPHTWAPTSQLARRWPMDFIWLWMAALPLPAVGGEADHPPQSGRDGSAFISLTKLGNKIINKFFVTFPRGGEERRRAEGQGAARLAWLVSHLPVVWPAPLPANRGGPPSFRHAGAEAALRPCAWGHD